MRPPSKSSTGVVEQGWSRELEQFAGRLFKGPGQRAQLGRDEWIAEPVRRRAVLRGAHRRPGGPAVHRALRPEGRPPAYAWADKPTLPSYSPIQYYSANPGNLGIFIERQDVGAYRVVWSYAAPHMNGQNGFAQVTAYGSNAQCKFVSAGKFGQYWNHQVAYVHCYAPNGTRVDSRFMVMSGN